MAVFDPTVPRPPVQITFGPGAGVALTPADSASTYVLRQTLAATVVATAHALARAGEQIPPQVAVYAEKRGGFQCGTCMYHQAVNATHGKCAIVEGVIHLTEGCCAMWEPDTAQLHLYREPVL